MGSKSRIAGEIIPIIQNYITHSGVSAYVEPFVGGANVIDKVEAPKRWGSDINAYLIALLQYIQQGGELPEHMSRDEYAAVRAKFENYPPWYVGCVGFLASYNGRFFDGGYAGIVHTKAGTVRDYYAEARRNVLRQAEALRGITFHCRDYRTYSGPQTFADCVIYCDPPYEGAKQYVNSVRFDHQEFWNTAREWSRHNIVLISEHAAPPDFVCIWEQPILRTVDNKKRVRTVEKLYKFKGRL